LAIAVIIGVGVIGDVVVKEVNLCKLHPGLGPVLGVFPLNSVPMAVDKFAGESGSFPRRVSLFSWRPIAIGLLE
jgi:hypothetical protein